MTANPELVSEIQFLRPQPFQHEVFALRRDSISVEIDGLLTRSGRWEAWGALFLSNYRLTFVAHQTDGVSGLQAFDLPLAYIRKHKFNQPIFGCNNLAGEVWSSSEGGGPSGNLPPHKFAIYFKNGGVGTFLPLFFSAYDWAQKMQHQHVTQSSSDFQESVATALVDPSDPTKIYLTNPGERDNLAPAPQYAQNYGQDEKYEGWDENT